MKRLWYVLFCVFGICVVDKGYSQNIKDYFYPSDGTYIFVYSEDPTTYHSKKIVYLGNNEYNIWEDDVYVSNYGITTKLGYGMQTILITDDRIICKGGMRKVLQGKVVSLSKNNINLMLPKPNKPISWKDRNMVGIAANRLAKLVTLNIPIAGGTKAINAIEVSVNGTPIEYWAKGYGLVFSWGSIIPGFENYTVSEYYDVEAREREMREKAIHDFLVMRDSTFFRMEPSNKIYLQNKDILSDCLRKVVERLKNDNLDLLITDKCRIYFDGKTKHNIKISGLGSDDRALVSALLSEMENVALSPMEEKEPYTGNLYSVNSDATFSLNYSRNIINEPLRVYKGNNGNVTLKRGTESVFNSNASYLSKELKLKGRYDLVLVRKDVCNEIIERNVTIKNFCKPIDNWFIEYNFSKAAPLGITVGANKIAYSKYWGAYFRYKSDFPDGRKLDDTNFEYTTERPKKEGYVRKGYTVGTTFAVFNNVYLYAGLGYGSCAVRYTNEGAAYDNVYGNKSYYQANLMKGLEVEGGCIWRFWKWMGVSVGYSTIVPFVKPDSGKFFGDINCGISLFL